MDKTLVVRVDSLSPHPLYKKRVRKSAKFVVHDENNEAHTGDFVRIVEGRPQSKTKSWRLADIVRAGGSRAVAQELVAAEDVDTEAAAEEVDTEAAGAAEVEE
jgi:small subunit ribosomal protein S17